MSITYDIVIVGGGAIGASCAWTLARRGERVLVLERGGAIGQAWQAAAGMLAPQIEAHADDTMFRFGLAARDTYGELAAALQDATGVNIGLWQEGIVQVARDEVEAAELSHKVAWQQRAGQSAEWVDAEDAHARWPWLGPSLGVLVAPRDGAVEPVKLVEALRADAERAGAVFLEDTILGLEYRHGRVTHVRGQRATHTGGSFLIAAGAWTGQLDGLPRHLPVEPVRGQMLALARPAGVPRAIVYGSNGYLVVRADGIVAGSTMERAGFDDSTTPAGRAAILAEAIALCPALEHDPRIQRHWAGLRPIAPDGLPIIGVDPAVPNLWYATGHGRNGILLAALTGEIVADLLDHVPPCLDVTPFAPGRFLVV